MVDPKSSINTKKHITLNPRPMNCGEPYPSATSPLKQVGPGIGLTPRSFTCAAKIEYDKILFSWLELRFTNKSLLGP